MPVLVDLQCRKKSKSKRLKRPKRYQIKTPKNKLYLLRLTKSKPTSSKPYKRNFIFSTIIEGKKKKKGRRNKKQELAQAKNSKIARTKKPLLDSLL